MIIEAICSLAVLLLNAILDVLDILPSFPVEFVNIVDDFFALIFDNVYLLSFFVRISTLKIAIPIFIVIVNFERIYKFVMWILRKIPMGGIE